MKKIDTDALRERLNSFSPEQQMEKDKEELVDLTEKIGMQIAGLHSLFKEINGLKEELQGIHSCLNNTLNMECNAFFALDAAKKSVDNIVSGLYSAIVKAEQETVIHATVSMEELSKVRKCSAAHIKAEERMLEEHCRRQERILERHNTELAKCLRKGEGIWLSDRWIIFVLIVNFLCYLVMFLYCYLKE